MLVKQYLQKRDRTQQYKVSAIQWTGKNTEDIEQFIGNFGKVEKTQITIGIHTGTINDYIVRDIMHVYYPCSEALFKRTFVEVK